MWLNFRTGAAGLDAYRLSYVRVTGIGFHVPLVMGFLASGRSACLF